MIKFNKKNSLGDINQSGATNGQIPTYNAITGLWEAVTPLVGSTLTSDNGLTKTGSNLQLGGSLIKATDITYGVNTFTETINGIGSHKIVGSGTASDSSSTGGFVNFTQVGDGAGLVAFTNRNAATTGNLVHLNVVGGPLYNRQALRVDYTGGSNASTIYNKNTNQLGSVAVNVVSDNVADSAQFITGRENARGTLKIGHINSSGTATGDASAAAISIDLQDNDIAPYSVAGTTGTSCQGIFMTSTSVGGFNGSMLQFRNNKTGHNSGLSLLRVDSEGRLIVTPAISGTQAIQVGLQGVTNLSYSVLTNGTQQWGSGTAIFDVNLARLSPNTLKLSNPLGNDGRLIIGPTGAGHSRLYIDGRTAYKVNTVIANTTLDINFSTLIAGATGNTHILPDATTCQGATYVFKNTTFINTTISCFGPQTIDGVVTLVMPTIWQKATIQSTGANWVIIA